MSGVYPVAGPPLLVTGGCGFIGANFIQEWFAAGETTSIVNLDALTYAGNPGNLATLPTGSPYTLVHGNLTDRTLLAGIFAEHRPRAVIHFAAETHVDRSISGPEAFLRSNLEGTFALLEAARAFWTALPPAEHAGFRLLHVSTDEVYGALEPAEAAFTEQSPYRPNSPYAASKAGSDHLVRAWHATYGLPTLVTNCSNNYGPYQFPEKLIPLVLLRALGGEPLPVYGDGAQVRDWLFVADHCEALRRVLTGGRVGETYNIGGGTQQTTLEVVRSICTLLDELRPDSPHRPYAQLIRHVTDRPGHDRRYAIDAGKMERQFGWRPHESFASGLRRTVEWYLANGAWLAELDARSASPEARR